MVTLNVQDKWKDIISVTMVTLNVQDKWEDIIPEKKSVLEWAACVRGDLLVTIWRTV